MKRLIALLPLLLAAGGIFAATESELLARAEGHYRAGNYLLAQEEYGELVSRFPLSDKAADAQYYRAVSLLRLGRTREALALLADIQARYRSTRYFQYVYFWEGTARLELQEHEAASRAFEQFLAGSQDEEIVPQALLGKARAELALGRTAAAAKDLEQLVRRPGGSPAGSSAVVLLAYAYLKEGRANEVLALTAATPEESLPAPSRDLFRLYQAEALWGLGRRSEALPLYSQLRTSSTAVAAVAFRRLFTAGEEKADLAQMQSLMQEAEARFAGSPAELQDLWVQIGIESVRQGKFDLAEYFLSKVWEQPGRRSLPDSVPLYLAETRLARGRLDEAVSLLAEYLALEPARADRVLLRLGELRLRQGRFTEASDLFERYLTAHPSSPDAPEAGYRLAYARFRLGSLDSARELAARLLEQSPGGSVRPDLYRLLVAVHRQKGDLRTAASLLSAYTGEQPADVKARLDLLRLYFSLREYPALVTESVRLQQISGLKDSNPYAYLLAGYLRGLAETARKQHKNVLAALAPLTREATDKAGLAPVYPYTLYYQAWAHYRLGQVREARVKAVELLDGHPSHALLPKALYLAGWFSYSLEDYRAAADHFARLARTEGEPAVRALYLQGKSLAAMGQKQEAARVFRTLSTVHSKSAFADDALFDYAELLAESDQSAEAAAAYRDLAQRFPDSPLAEEALYKRAEAFAGARSWPQARDAYQEYRTRYPKGRLVDAALYWGGIASAETGESFGAVLQWEKLIDGYKTSPFRADALRRTAEAYAQRGDYGKAISLHTALYKEYPEEAKAFGTAQRLEELNYRLRGAGEREAALSSVIGREGGARSAKGREAMIELAQLYIYEGSSRLELAPPMLQQVVDKQEPSTAARAQYLLGEYWLRRSEPNKAAQDFLKAAALNPQDADRTASALYRAAEMMKLAGRPQDVRELVGRLEKFFPGSQWTLEARKLLEGGSR